MKRDELVDGLDKWADLMKGMTAEAPLALLRDAIRDGNLQWVESPWRCGTCATHADGDYDADCAYCQPPDWPYYSEVEKPEADAGGEGETCGTCPICNGGGTVGPNNPVGPWGADGYEPCPACQPDADRSKWPRVVQLTPDEDWLAECQHRAEESCTLKRFRSGISTACGDCDFYASQSDCPIRALAAERDDLSRQIRQHVECAQASAERAEAAEARAAALLKVLHRIAICAQDVPVDTGYALDCVKDFAKQAIAAGPPEVRDE